MAELLYRVKDNITDRGYIELLPSEYAKGSIFGYYKGYEIPYSHGDYFEYLGNGYAGDDIHVYFEGEIIEAANPRTFKINSENPDYSSDRYYTFFKGKRVPFGDKDTFKFLNNHLAIDKNSVYYHGEKQELIDRNTFTIINYFASEDKENVYIIKYTSPLKSELISYKKITDFELKHLTTEYLLGKWLEDNDRLYLLDDKVRNHYIFPVTKEIDKNTFEVIGIEGNNYYAKDKNHVYKNGEILEGADPETFTIPE